MSTAIVSGERVEDVSQRTQTSQSFANPDGSWTAEVSAEPVRVQDGEGSWHDIDSDLVERAGVLVPRYAVSDLELSTGGDTTFAAMHEDSRDLAWRWSSALPAPQVQGSTATYRDVVPNGDLVVTATSTGFEHSIVLHAPPVAPLAITTPIVTDGARLVESEGGGVAVQTTSGDTVVSAPSPVMFDASQDSKGEPQHVAEVDASIGENAAGTPTLTLRPSDAFLSDPDTEYPVVVDPSFSNTTTGDSWIQNAGFTTSQASSTQLRAGTYDSGAHVARSFLQFDTSAANGTQVVSAQLVMRNFSAASCTASAIRVNPIVDTWTLQDLTWANQPAVDSTRFTDFSPAQGFDSSCAEGDATWDITSLAQWWADGAPNRGVRVQAVDETSNATWRTYRSGDYGVSSPFRPRVVVTYDGPPSVPTNLQVSPCRSGCLDPYVTDTTRPLLTASATDPDAGTLSYRFQVRAPGASTMLVDSTTSAIPSAGEASFRVPAGALAMGQNYEFRVAALDAHNTTWGSWRSLTTSPTAFASPTVISSPQTLTQDTTWTPDQSPYVLDRSVSVAYGSTLTIQPGTVIKSSAPIVVYGRLRAEGTKTQPIVFTSKADDSVGGDYGGDGAATTPQPGNYAQAIIFADPVGTPSGDAQAMASSRPASKISNTAFRYGGSAVADVFDVCGGIRDGGIGAVTTGTLTRVSIENSEFSNQKCGAISVGYLDPQIAEVTVRSSWFQPQVSGAAIRAAFGGTFVDNYFSDTATTSISAFSGGSHDASAAHAVFKGNWLLGPVSIEINGDSCTDSLSREEYDFENNAMVGRWKITQCAWTQSLVLNDLSNNYWPSLVPPNPNCWSGNTQHNPEWAMILDVVQCGAANYANHNQYFTNVLPVADAPPWPNPGLESNPAQAPTLDGEQLLGTHSGEFAIDPTGDQADPVNSATGSYTEAITDASVPGTGLDLNVDRTYNSLDTTLGSLGTGWSFGYDAHLSFDEPGTIKFKAGDGQGIVFRQAADGSWVGATGVTAVLTHPSNPYLLQTRSGLTYAFNATTGRLVSVTDRHGNVESLTYEAGHLKSVTNGSRTISFTYTGARLTQVALPDGRSIGYRYTSNLLTSVTDQTGAVTTYAYDANGRLKQVTDPLQRVRLRLDYNPTTGRVSDQWDGAEDHTSFAWNPATGTATMTDPRGNNWVDVYDGSALVKRTDPNGKSWRFRWDGNLHLQQVEDAAGNFTTLSYDTKDNLTRVVGPNGTVTTDYNDLHKPTRSVNPRGYASTISYNTTGDPISVQQPAVGSQTGPSGSSTYYANGQLKTNTDARGKTTTYTYTADGDLLSITSPTGLVTTYEYTGIDGTMGLPSAMVSPAGGRTTYTYDALGRVRTLTNPVGRTTRTDYDTAGRLETQTDAKNRVTTYTYDDADRVQTITSPNSAGQPLTYTYDAVGNTKTLTDPAGRITTYTYDPAQQVSGVTGPQGSWSYAHNPMGDLTAVTGPDNVTTKYSYTSGGQLAQVNYADPSTPDVRYTYDANGNRRTMADGSGATTYTYDARDQLRTVQRTAAGSTATFSYGYGSGGELNQLTYPNATTIDYAYDAEGRPTSLRRNGQALVTYDSYTADSQLQSATIGTGTGEFKRTYTYTAADQLKRLQDVMTSGTTILDDSYAYDATGNPYLITHADGTQDRYQYDTLDRLTKICYQTNTCTGATNYLGWTYDPVGNRKTETRTTGTTTYTYNTGTGRLDSIAKPGAPSISYGYDTRGRVTTAAGTTYTYNEANRTTSETTSGATTTYTYDGDGRRLQAVTGNQTTHFTWDPTTYALVAETDSAGTQLHEYPEGIGVTDSTGGIDYFHTDLQGSVRALTDATGQTLQTTTFEPFGNIASQTPTQAVQPFGFAGQYSDPSGKQHLRARQYDPTTGAFTQPDALGGPSVGDNYAYANDNPMVYADPSGLSPTNWIGGLLNSAQNWLARHPFVDTVISSIPIISTARALVAIGSACLGNTGSCATAVLMGLAFVAGGVVLGKLASVGMRYAAPYLSSATRSFATRIGTSAANGGRVFASADAHVASAANAVEAALPGRVVGVNTQRAMSNGLTREVDIDLGDLLVQVKSGKARGLAGQITRTRASTGTPTIGYAPGISDAAWGSAARQGIPILRSPSELLAYLREFG